MGIHSAAHNGKHQMDNTRISTSPLESRHRSRFPRFIIRNSAPHVKPGVRKARAIQFKIVRNDHPTRHPRGRGDPVENPEKEGLTISRIQNIISGMDRKPVVYIMTNKPNGTLYTGVTSDLVQRVWEHRQGIHPGFSKRYGTKVLVWYEWHSRMDTAIAREKALKKWNRHWKVRMIEEFNADWSDLYPLLLG